MKSQNMQTNLSLPFNRPAWKRNCTTERTTSDDPLVVRIDNVEFVDSFGTFKKGVEEGQI